VLLPIALSWSLIVDLTPANQRPYVGSSSTNSELDLALGYNGVQRSLGNRRGGPGQTNTARASNDQVPTVPNSGPQNGQPPVAPATGGTQPGSNGNPGGPGGFGPGGAGGQFGTGQPGALRLFQAGLAAQVSWLLPFGLFMLIAMAASRAWWRPQTPLHQGLILWGGWLLTCIAFFSIAGFFVSFLDPNFYLIAAKPDNVPIGGMIFLLGIFTWIALRKAYLNDKQIAAGGIPWEKTESDEKLFVWPDLVNTELPCFRELLVAALVANRVGDESREHQHRRRVALSRRGTCGRRGWHELRRDRPGELARLPRQEGRRTAPRRPAARGRVRRSRGIDTGRDGHEHLPEGLPPLGPDDAVRAAGQVQHERADADRRRRRDHALELADESDRREGVSGARYRLHRDPQALRSRSVLRADRGRRVLRGVVGDDDLEVLILLSKPALQSPRHELLRVVNRHADAHQWNIGGLRECQGESKILLCKTELQHEAATAQSTCPGSQLVSFGFFV